jgi:hypothetical protein
MSRAQVAVLAPPERVDGKAVHPTLRTSTITVDTVSPVKLYIA